MAGTMRKFIAGLPVNLRYFRPRRSAAARATGLSPTMLGNDRHSCPGSSLQWLRHRRKCTTETPSQMPLLPDFRWTIRSGSRNINNDSSSGRPTPRASGSRLSIRSPAHCRSMTLPVRAPWRQPDRCNDLTVMMAATACRLHRLHYVVGHGLIYSATIPRTSTLAAGR